MSESTFGLPIYRWAEPQDVMEEINRWWRKNQEEKRTSVLFGYSLGKAQRLLAGVNPSLGPIFVHSAIRELLPLYAEEGVVFPSVENANVRKGVAAGELFS